MWLANPIGLWALAGLLVPIAIHLLSRKEGPVIRIGSLRHLNESATQQFRSIRLNEKLLLAVRLLLLLLMVLMLAQLHTPFGAAKKWVLVEPSLQTHPLAIRAADSLTQQGYELHALSAGFPTEPGAASGADNYDLLVAELQKQPLEKAVVLSSSRLLQFGWSAAPLPDFVTWITVEPDDKAFVLVQKQIGTDSLLVRTGWATAGELSFESKIVPVGTAADSVALTPIDSIHVSIYAEESMAAQARLIEQALQIVASQTRTTIVTTPYAASTQPDWVVWLSAQPVPLHVKNSIAFRETARQSLLTPASANHWLLTKPLSTELAWKENLPVQLAAIVLPKQQAKQRADAHDARVLNESMQWRSTTALGTVAPGTSAHAWLAALLALLFLAERTLAYWKKA